MHPEGCYCPFNDGDDTLDGYRYESNESRNNLHTHKPHKIEELKTLVEGLRVDGIEQGRGGVQKQRSRTFINSPTNETTATSL